MNSQILNKNQLIKRSVILYNNALNLKKSFNKIDDDFIMTINYAGDAVELLLKGINTYLNKNFTTGHNYKNIIDNIYNNLNDKYKFKFMKVTDLSNKTYLEGKLLHEAKYSDENTKIPNKIASKLAIDTDFYKKLKISDLDDTLKYYEDLKNLFLEIILNESNIIYDKNIDMYYNIIKEDLNYIIVFNNTINNFDYINNDDNNINKKLYNLIDKYIQDISYFVKLWINQIYLNDKDCKNIPSYLNFLNDFEDDFPYIKEFIFFSNIDTNFDINLFINQYSEEIIKIINRYFKFVEVYNNYCKNVMIYMH